MERYNEYKATSIQWLVEIPSHWEERRYKYCLHTVKSKSNLPYKVGLENIESYSGRYIPTEVRYDGDGVDAKKGDILYGKLRPYLAKVWIAELPCNAVGDFFVYRCNEEYILRQYAKWLMLSDGFTKLCSASTYGAKMPRVSANFIDSIFIPLPSIKEQEKIVSYIESKTSKIDEYIAEKEKEVQLLNELKEAEIAKVVTQGLNPNVKMKDSGISWIGMIPEHWEVKRIASLFTGKVNTNSDFAYQHAFKFYYGTLVPKDEVGDAEEYKETYVKYQVIQKDDILINGLNLNYDFVSQRVAIAPSDGIITSAYIVARPRKGTNADYYNYLFKAMDSKKLFHGMGTGIRLTLSFDELKKQIVVCPPIEEQQAIVTYINDKTAKVESLITDLQAEIEHLKEYKQRLIADCVTGQVNVAGSESRGGLLTMPSQSNVTKSNVQNE